jgi:hypothetical protein
LCHRGGVLAAQGKGWCTLKSARRWVAGGWRQVRAGGGPCWGSVHGEAAGRRRASTRGMSVGTGASLRRGAVQDTRLCCFRWHPVKGKAAVPGTASGGVADEGDQGVRGHMLAEGPMVPRTVTTEGRWAIRTCPPRGPGRSQQAPRGIRKRTQVGSPLTARRVRMVVEPGGGVHRRCRGRGFGWRGRTRRSEQWRRGSGRGWSGGRRPGRRERAGPAAFLEEGGSIRKGRVRRRERRRRRAETARRVAGDGTGRGGRCALRQRRVIWPVDDRRGGDQSRRWHTCFGRGAHVATEVSDAQSSGCWLGLATVAIRNALRRTRARRRAEDVGPDFKRGVGAGWAPKTKSAGGCSARGQGAFKGVWESGLVSI